MYWSRKPKNTTISLSEISNVELSGFWSTGVRIDSKNNWQFLLDANAPYDSSTWFPDKSTPSPNGSIL